MIRTEEFSFPSDILSEDLQQQLYSDVGTEMEALFREAAMTHLSEQKDYKPAIDYVPICCPPPVLGVLSNEEYTGPYEFEVSILPNNKQTKNPWVYSAMLNKVFMDMLCPFPVDFKIKNRTTENLFIRVTPQYSSPQCAQDAVYRCFVHEHPSTHSNLNIPENVRQHIIRCDTNPHSIYVGDKNQNERLSVVIPLLLPQCGAESVREIFRFMCKNSCPTPGMNRRSLEIVFTLEDENWSVLGRKSLFVRICSCPKRDKEKEEKEAKEKSGATLSRGKKRKIDMPEKKVINCDNDTKEYTINIKLVGKHNVQQVLKYCSDLMSGEVLRHADSPQLPIFKHCLDDINAKKNQPIE